MTHPQYRQYISVTEWQHIHNPVWLEERARARMTAAGATDDYAILYDYATDESIGDVIILDAIHRDDLLTVLRQRHAIYAAGLAAREAQRRLADRQRQSPTA